MGSSSARNMASKVSNGVIAKNRFVKFAADGVKIEQCGLNERAIGISQTEATAANQTVDVAELGGGGTLQFGGIVTAGKLLTSDANGKGTVADAAGEWCGAQAFESGVDGDIGEVKVIATQAQASDA